MHHPTASTAQSANPAEPGKPASTAASSRPRRTPSKPQTPSDSGNDTDAVHRHRKLSSEHKRAKPTFTTSLSFPEAAPLPTPLPTDDGDAGRAQRRSKVEALTKIDRAGTPLTASSTGPAATSFIPAAQVPPPSAISGPSVARNPLHRPPVVNPPFSLDSVRTSAPRHPPSRSGTRLFGLQECPVYYPTAEQWKDCMAYIDSIAPEAKAFGICKIVPPEGWRMPFVLETDKFRFKTRLQRLNSLEAASRAKINFLEQLQLYYQQADSKLNIPIIDRRPIDLYQLRKAVNKIGGQDEVDRMKGWAVIAKTLGYDEKYAHLIKAAYMRIILPFDTFANGGKSASGSPLTPMPSTTASKPPGFANESPSSPTVKGRMGSTRQPPGFSERPGQPSRALSPSLKPVSLPPRDLSPPDVPSRPSSAASSLTTIKIKVPGFSSRDGSESELSDEDPSPKKKNVQSVPYQKGEVCEVCQRGDDGTKILLCDACDKGFHTYCLNPPLSYVPANAEWYCGPCLFAQGDGYGFDEGEDHSIPSFQARDLAFAQHWWSKHPTRSQPSDTTRDLGGSIVSEDDIEREFWRLTEDVTDTVEIEYGADVHSTTHGSGSPSSETHPLSPYSRDGWNLNNMPILPESLLRYIRSDISGMTVPWIYVGMMLSAFCWHNEDHYTYSVNYMHWGETKTWYGIPGSDAEKFEEAMKSEAPELFEQQPSLLYQLVTMMNPGRVSEAGVNVVACDQRPNEFVITFPKAYHCGFNHGINFNEAVNFALPDWLPDGREAVLKYKQHAKAPVFSHNELLINITLYSETIRTAIWLQDALKQMVDEETARRDLLRSSVALLTEQLVEEDGPEEQYQCCICKGFCYLSQVTCSCTALVACVDHADQLCKCASSKRTLRKRYSEAQLEEILAAVQARASQPQQWRSRLDNVLAVARPPLKSLRALLADGEKIAHDMPEVHYLRAMVDRANSWVEKFTAIATRKSTGRKKRRQTGHEDEHDRNPEVLRSLMEEAERLSFDAPEILQLRQMALSIQTFKDEAQKILSLQDDDLDIEDCERALILGQSLNLDLPEIQDIQKIVNRLRWLRKVGWEVDDRTMEYKDTLALLEEASEYGIPPEHPWVLELQQRQSKGSAWNRLADETLSAERIAVSDLDRLIDSAHLAPVSQEKLLQVESVRKQILTWQSTAKAQLDGHGSTTASQRLCKAVKTATGPLRHVDIPEVDLLQKELDFHAQWTAQVAQTVGVQTKQVTGFLNNLLLSMEQHLRRDDSRPSPDFTCFCRTPRSGVMVTCQACNVEYHPKCVRVSPSNVDKPFKCAMCLNMSYDDRPSLNALSYLSVPERYHFLIVPSDMTTLVKIIDIAVDFAREVLPFVDPFNTAVPCRDFNLLAHWHRKLFNLPVTFDLENTANKTRIVLEEWLWKRMTDAKKPVKAQMRQRKPKLVLRQSKPGLFACICTTPPNDPLITVECHKCQQSYHASCVKAPEECLGPDKVNWRCPCCTVRDARRYQQGNIPVRVQNSDRLGTDIFIDYRATISSFSTEILEYQLPPADCILLECIGFIKPIIPEGFKVPTVEEVRSTKFDEGNDEADSRQAKKRKVDTVVNGTPQANGPASNGVANGLTNGHGASYPATAVQTPLSSATTSAQPTSLQAAITPSVHPVPNERPPANRDSQTLAPHRDQTQTQPLPQQARPNGTAFGPTAGISGTATSFPSVLSAPSTPNSIIVNRPFNPPQLPWMANPPKPPVRPADSWATPATYGEQIRPGGLSDSKGEETRSNFESAGRPDDAGQGAQVPSRAADDAFIRLAERVESDRP